MCKNMDCERCPIDDRIIQYQVLVASLKMVLAGKCCKTYSCLSAQPPLSEHLPCQLQMESSEKEHKCKVAALEEDLAAVTRKLAELEAQRAPEESAATVTLQSELTVASTKLAQAEAALSLSQESVASMNSQLSSMRLEQTVLCNEAAGLRASLSAAKSAVQQQSANADTLESECIGKHLQPLCDRCIYILTVQEEHLRTD